MQIFCLHFTLSGAKESGSDSDSFDAACLQKGTFARLEKQVEGLPMKFDAICASLGMLPLKA